MKNHKLISVIVILIIILVLVIYQFLDPVSFFMTGVNARKFGRECSYRGQCGNIVAINCQAELDGPLYYVDKTSLDIIECCGGCCMMDSEFCKHCPPQEWNCD